MAKISETGHAKNVANFTQMVTICTSYGAKYNPSNPTLQLAQMNSSLALAKDCIAALNKAKAAVSNTTAARVGVFK
jgi:hypothetical protein